MAMRRCPTCRHSVASSALACPQCGDNLAARRSWWWALVIVVTMVLAAVGLGSTDHQSVASAPVRAAPPSAPAPKPQPEIRPADVGMVSADYQADVAQMLNLLRREHPRCRERLDPINAGMGQDQPNPANPMFFVLCGREAPHAVVRFSWMDAVNARLPTQPEAIAEHAAGSACEREAKSRANIPATVDFSRVWDAAFLDHGDGTATYASTFTARNALGIEGNFAIRCVFTGQALTRVTVQPAK